MKKLLSLLVALMLCCSFAVAEGLPVVQFDTALLSEIPGEYVLLEDFGLQMYMPAEFVSYEVTENDAATGALAIFGRENGSLMMTIALAGVADANGNLITTAADLAAFYQTQGVTAVEIIMNDLDCITYDSPEAGLLGIAFCTAEGYVLAFNILTADFEADKTFASLLLMSIFPAE